MNITYASFDEIPSFKGASTHILCGLRGSIGRARIELLSLGKSAIPPFSTFLHRPISIPEKNTLRRGLLFREKVQLALKRRPPDLVHFRSPWEGIAAVRSGIPSIFEVNGLPSVELPYHYKVSDNVLRVFRRWEEECLSGAVAVLCPSLQIVDFLKRHFPAQVSGKIHHIPNGYDPLPRRGVANSSEDKGPLRMVYIGTLSSWQGMHWALGVLRQLSGAWSLDVFAPYSKHTWRRFERRRKRSGLDEKVTLFEPINRAALFDALPQYDIGLAPFLRTQRNTEQGCYPLKILDYLSHGLPVLSSRMSIVEPLLREGANSFLYEPNSRESLLALLETLRDKPPRAPELREFCVRSLDGHPTWDDYGERLYELYRSLLGNSAAVLTMA